MTTLKNTPGSQSPIIVALDFDNAASCMQLVNQLNPADCRLKIGKELFTTCGPSIVEAVQKAGFDVFLDLKFHDIPATVGKAIRAAANLGVWMVNVHSSGGGRMLDAARDAVLSSTHQPLLIGVTVLTSMEASDLLEAGIEKSPAEQVDYLAALVSKHGLDGVVCSAQESSRLKAALGQDFTLVTPGIRPVGAAQGDQRRVMTPREALQAGSDYLVIGRPITQAENPAAVCDAIIKDIAAIS